MLPQQQIVGLILSALSAAPSLAAGGAIAHTTRPLPEAVASRICVRVDSAQRSEPYTGEDTPVEWDLDVVIECTARAASGQTADAAAAALAEAALARLMGASALPAGWEIDRRRIDLRADREELDERIGSLSIVLIVRCMAHPTTHAVSP